MLEEHSDLRGFTHLSVLHRKAGTTFYRLLYPETSSYLEVSPQGARLLDAQGDLHTGEVLQPLLLKVRQFERLFSRSIMREDLSGLLRLDEVSFLLEELNISNIELEQQLAERLYAHLRRPYVRRFHQPLVLPRLLARHEFVTIYLQTNIGLPEDSDNYYNKLREMIEQIEEQIAYVEPDYFNVVRAMLLVSSSISPSGPVVFSTRFSSCFLVTGTDLLPPRYHGFTGPPDLPFPSVKLDNQLIYKLIQQYQALE